MITGGDQIVSNRVLPEWELYREAMLLELDTDTGRTRTLLRYHTPPQRQPEGGGSHVFKGLSRCGHELLISSQTEVLRVEASTMAIVERLSDETFNDVHFALEHEGQVLVVSTGLDAVIVIDAASGKVVERQSVLDEDIWSRFSPSTDYRRVPTTKPHKSHPNCSFITQHGPWVTRMGQRDAICLSDRSRRIEIGPGMPHDGLVHGGAVWFTTVNGWLVETDPESGNTHCEIDLNATAADERPLGWCRGLGIVDDIAYIGFSRLRQTKFRENVSWVRHGFRRVGAHAQMPTRVVGYHLRRRETVGEWDLEPSGLGMVFSVVPAP